MEQLDFSDIDTVKAFFMLLLGATLGAILIYIYDTSIAPHLAGVLSSPSATGAIADAGAHAAVAVVA